MHKQIKPETVLEQLGGCGRYQILLATTLHTMKLICAWSMYTMVLAAAVPEWKCINGTTSENFDDNNSWTAISNVSLVKTCDVGGNPCKRFEFGENINTMVSEVGVLTLGKKSLVHTTLYMARLLHSCIFKQLCQYPIEWVND